MNMGALGMPNKRPTLRRPMLRGDLPFMPPGGRLTITTGVPKLIAASTTAQTTVYWTPDEHGRAPFRFRDRWYHENIAEISQALADDTRSPAAATTDSLYDLFLWKHIKWDQWFLSRGPLWTDATNRSAGTALARWNGARMNAVDIVNGPKAGHGLFVGTIATNGSTQLAMMFRPTPAAGGTANRLDVWNMFNRVDIGAVCRDSTNTWTYSTATIRSANAAAGGGVAARITLVRGLDEDIVHAKYLAFASLDTTAHQMATGIGLDSTTAFATGCLSAFTGFTDSAGYGAVPSELSTHPGLGQHFFNANEWSEATANSFWYGDNGQATVNQSGLIVRTRM